MDTVDTLDMADIVDLDTATEAQALSMKFPITVQLTLRYRSSICKNNRIKVTQMNHPQPSSKHLQELAFKEVPSPDLSKVAPASTETSPAFFPEHAKTQDQGEEEYEVVPQIDQSVPQPVVQSRRRPLLGPSPG